MGLPTNVVVVVPVSTGMVHPRSDISMVRIVPVVVMEAGAQAQQPDQCCTDDDYFVLVHGV